MKINKRLAAKIFVIASIVLLILVLGLTIRQQQINKKNKEVVLLVGVPEDGGIQKELKNAFEQANYIKQGKQLMRENKIDEAIAQLEIGLSLAKSSGSKGVAIVNLANAYEKKKDYKKALEYIIIDRDKYVNDWAKEPIVERAVYLEYALKGEYELAVEHAKKALEADSKLPNSPKDGRPDYIERLNDLKAAKDYILSLKKQ